jgi:hypothetical protein
LPFLAAETEIARFRPRRNSPATSHRTQCRLDARFRSARSATFQLLLEGETPPVRVGSRASEILVALVGRPSGLVSKRELIARLITEEKLIPSTPA